MIVPSGICPNVPNAIMEIRRPYLLHAIGPTGSPDHSVKDLFHFDPIEGSKKSMVGSGKCQKIKSPDKRQGKLYPNQEKIPYIQSKSKITNPQNPSISLIFHLGTVSSC